MGGPRKWTLEYQRDGLGWRLVDRHKNAGCQPGEHGEVVQVVEDRGDENVAKAAEDLHDLSRLLEPGTQALALCERALATLDSVFGPPPSPSDRGDLGAVREIAEQIRWLLKDVPVDHTVKLLPAVLLQWADRLDSAASASPAREEPDPEAHVPYLDGKEIRALAAREPTEEEVERGAEAMAGPLYEMTRQQRDGLGATEVGALTREGHDARRELARAVLSAARGVEGERD
jgi:hypothetical protein